jgi:hypothetical protein
VLSQHGDQQLRYLGHHNNIRGIFDTLPTILLIVFVVCTRNSISPFVPLCFTTPGSKYTKSIVE